MFSKCSIYLHFSIWIYFVFYSLYTFTITTQQAFHNYNDTYNDFTNVSEIFHLKRDKSDFEWETINQYIQNYYSVIILHSISIQFLRYTQKLTKNVIQEISIAFTLIFIFYNFGLIVVLILISQPVLFSFIIETKSTARKWTLSFVCLAFITAYKQLITNEQFTETLNINEYDNYLIIMSLFWMNLKCSSYSLNEGQEKSSKQFITYTLYLPTFFCGPFISSTDFSDIYAPIKGEKFIHLLKNITKCLIYWLFGNVLLHFCYLNAINFHPEEVRYFDYWSIGGYGYAMGQFFHLKYVIWYGLSTSLATFDNIRVPFLPRCIGRVHLYSDMWKYFDYGLYKYLKHYIYVPILSKVHSKVIASLFCFSFVFIWHGIEYNIFVWALFNFLGVCIENFAQKLSRNHLKPRQIKVKLERLINCLFAAPLLVLSAISNFYFFGGAEIGDIFLEKLFFADFFTLTVIFLAMYSCCQVSTEIRLINATKMH